jgi:hypothetical protein
MERKHEHFSCRLYVCEGIVDMCEFVGWEVLQIVGSTIDCLLVLKFMGQYER